MRYLLASILFASLTLAGCDSIAPSSLDEPLPAADAAALMNGDASRSLPLCVPRGDGDFASVRVPRDAAVLEFDRGALLPNTGSLDENCQSVERRSTCPCFTAQDLMSAYGGAAPLPYLHFDTFNWYGLDYRRTEVRAFVDVDGGVAEAVASVYITPGSESQPVLMCHRQSIQADPIDGSPEFVYVTMEPTVAQAEACRRTLSAFAAAVDCQGPACGMAYTPAQLDPNYPHYDGGRAAPPANDSIQRQIARAQGFVSSGR